MSLDVMLRALTYDVSLEMSSSIHDQIQSAWYKTKVSITESMQRKRGLPSFSICQKSMTYCVQTSKLRFCSRTDLMWRRNAVTQDPVANITTVPYSPKSCFEP